MLGVGNNDWVKVFRRLDTKLPTNNVSRAKIIWSCVFLHNLRVNVMGRSQIKTYFEFINHNNEITNNSNNNNNN